MEKRYLQMHDIKTRSADDEKIVEGYFAVFNENYEVWPGATESIAPGAFKDALNGDIRALYNHNDDIVLGRTSAGTLFLNEDERGLHGSIKINPKDTEALNVYERISRGDITGCSFGFSIESEKTDLHDDGSVHWTIEKVRTLYEVSPCAFPAYEATSIASRGKEIDQIKKRQADAWKASMHAKLKGGHNGTESTVAPEKN